MKKILSLMGCGILCVALTGCGGNGADVVCTKKTDEANETYSVYADGDDITKVEMEVEAEAQSEEEAKMVEALYSGLFGGLADQSDGAVECDIERSGKSLSIVLSVDVKAAKKAGIDNGAVIPEATKVDEFIKSFEAEGYDCD